MTQPTISRVLGALPSGLDSVTGLAVALQLPQHEVLDALHSLALAGLAVRTGPDDDAGWHLTPAGVEAVRGGPELPRGSLGGSVSFSFTSIRGAGRQPTPPEWPQIDALVGQAFSVAREAREVEQEGHEQSLLVGDAERELALQLLAQAFGDGRLSQEEHDRRTGIVLQAADRGDLDQAMTGLAVEGQPRPSAGYSVGFWLLGALAVPVLVLALLIIAADGSGPSEKLVAGLVLLVLIPGLITLGLMTRRRQGLGPHWRP